MGRRRNRLPPDPVTVQVTDMSHDGRGVARVDDKAVFIDNALPGETVRFTYTSRRRSFDQGIAQEILEASPDRVQPRCPHFNDCGGCAMQHLAPAAQIQAKHKVLVDNLERLGGGLVPARWLEPLSGDAWGYRRKARLSVKNVPKKGRVLVGFRERNGRYVCDMHECHTLIEEVGFRLDAMSQLIGSLSAPDCIPQIEVAAGDAATVLLVRHLEPLSREDQDKLEQFGTQHGFVIYLQSGGPATVQPLSAPATLSFHLQDQNLTYQFNPHNFVQVNAQMNQLMVTQAVDLLDPEPTDRALDLFCGLGNFTLPLAQRAASVTGIEGEQSLVQLAQSNARDNAIENVAFAVGDLSQSPPAGSWAKEKFDVVLLDPPRSGASELMPMLPALGARRIVYVSCHPGSLARDAALLTQGPYTLAAAGIMDMFPHTAHVESIAVFDRRS